jgi:hypothetical protein
MTENPHGGKLDQKPPNTKLLFALLIGIASILTIGSSGRAKVVANPNEAMRVSAAEIVSGSLCLNRKDIPEEDYNWLYIPVNPEELHTEVDYFFLAGQLIQNQVVDATACPAGGLTESGYANACGAAKAHDIVLQMQNQYDNEILNAWKQVGVPPVMLKQLIRYESQFWPYQYAFYHFGLGHVTFAGAYTALSWSPVMFQTTCTAAYGSMCDRQLIDDMMVGTFLGMMNASCPTCEWKVNVPKAEASIYYLAHTLLAFCRQASQTVYNATNFINPSEVVDYATIWKLTLYNYNVGPNCLYNAVQKAEDEVDGIKLTWTNIADNVEGDACLTGVDYVNNITRRFYDFSP